MKRRGRKPTARNAKIARYYANGNTLEQTGTKFGITKQRVQQILKQFFPDVTRPALVNQRRHYQTTLKVLARTK